LLVPHFHIDSDEIQWIIPGGKVQFGESISSAAKREFYEETKGYNLPWMGRAELSKEATYNHSLPGL
jgi:predicted NUDIX family NTP pyrophosphohydrolase